MKAFCPRCGEETRGLGSRGLCSDCYLGEHTLLSLPDEIDAERCRHCGRVKIGMDWVDAERDQDVIYAVLDHAIDDDEAVRAVTFEEDDDDYRVTVLVEQTVDGELLQDEVETTILVEWTQCETCAKFHGGYYQYKIQLRGDEAAEALEPVMDRAAELTDRDREDFLAGVEEQDGGYDIYVSTRDMADELIKVLKKLYDVETQRTKELLGEEDGERVYRSVISARIP